MNNIYMLIFMLYRIKTFFVYKTKNTYWRVKNFIVLNVTESAVILYFLLAVLSFLGCLQLFSKLL